MSGAPSTQQVARAMGGLTLLLGAVALVSGVVLAWRYHPAQRQWLSVLHSSTSALAVTSALATWIVRRGGQVRFTPRGAAILAVIVISVGAALATGTGLAWEGDSGEARGVFGLPDQGLTIDGRAVTGSEIVGSFVVHVAASVVAATALAAVLVRRPARQPRPPSGAPGGS